MMLTITRGLGRIGYCFNIPRTYAISRGISKFPVPSQATLPHDIRSDHELLASKGGFLPNVYAALSHRPQEHKAFFSYYDVLMNKNTGNLSKADRELIVIATSAENNCLYCVVAHSALHRVFSRDPRLADQVATNWRGADLTERERAILSFAMEVCFCRSPSKQHYTALEEQGLDEEDAWDIGAISAFFALSNRMAFLTEMKPNKEFHILGRVPKDMYAKLNDEDN